MSHKAGKTNASGGLKPLAERLTDVEQIRRIRRLHARRTVAEQLREQAAFQGAAIGGILAVLRRGIFGRIKWLLFGK